MTSLRMLFKRVSKNIPSLQVRFTVWSALKSMFSKVLDISVTNLLRLLARSSLMSESVSKWSGGPASRSCCQISPGTVWGWLWLSTAQISFAVPWVMYVSRIAFLTTRGRSGFSIIVPDIFGARFFLRNFFGS